MIQFLDQLDNFIWGTPLLVLLVGTGIMLTIRLGLIQVTKLPQALKLIFKSDHSGEGDISSFGALCTALAATVGTGNIIGVATALAAGGPGALFWMWLAAFFGMATKYAEGVLAIKYRQTDANGQVAGGPMYYITNGMGEKFKPLAIFFAFSGILVALLGIGTFTQVNAITSSIENTLHLPAEVVGIVLAILVGIVTFGGINSISKVAEKIVPVMAISYLIICLTILATHYASIVPAFQLIFESAFTPLAAVGGFTGATVAMAIRNGIARGVFSNESGLGSAPIAAAAAKTEWAAEQGLISMTGTFIDSLIICTLTGLTLMVTGVWQMEDVATGALTETAFNTVLPTMGGLPLGSLLLMVCLSLFAFTTILDWNYYGERCCEFLFGVKSIMPYRLIFVLMVGLGAFLQLEAVWLIADIVNGLMALPNLIAIVALSGIVVAETKAYSEYLQQSKLQSVEAIQAMED
ncbi:MAG: sodium:alanine symporter family protein [Turicibacter sp.]|nr:sodium:alanine symporter family protein [Turicibacter sp.]